MNQKVKNFVQKYLDINQPITSTPYRLSCLIIALKSARELTGRDIKTGEYIDGKINQDTFSKGLYHSVVFSGLLMYLIILEQIGSIFQKKEYNNAIKNGVQIALENFSDTLTDCEEIKAIRALRNSFAHDFGLTNEKLYNYKQKGLLHKFTLSFVPEDDLVRLPNIPWKGDYTEKSDDTNTQIGIFKLCESIEKIIANVKKELLNDNLMLRIGLNELKSRFTIL